jgi:hypothetical protein
LIDEYEQVSESYNAMGDAFDDVAKENKGMKKEL